MRTDEPDEPPAMLHLMFREREGEVELIFVECREFDLCQSTADRVQLRRHRCPHAREFG